MIYAQRLWRFLFDNLGTFFIAIGLAVGIWVLAVLAADPNTQHTVIGGVSLTVVGQDKQLLLIEELPETIEVDLQAPESMWDMLDVDRPFTANVNLTGLTSGTHTVPVVLAVDAFPVRIVGYSPEFVTVVLEVSVSEEKWIQVVPRGEPAPGFTTEPYSISDRIVLVVGSESLVETITDVIGALDLSGTRESFISEVPLIPVDAEGNRVVGVTLFPQIVTINQPVVQAGGYRDVAVKVETIGQLANGYRVTNILVTPLTVTVFSADPQLIAEMPGFVSTQPLDLTDANGDIDTRLSLALPEGVSLVGDEQSVGVEVGIAGIETSIAVNIPVEIIGLGAGLESVFSPESLDLILTGPLPVLDAMVDGDVRIYVDLTDLDIGTHFLAPQVEILLTGVIVESISPATIEVVVSIALATPQTPIITPEPGQPTETPTITPTPSN